MAYSIKYIKQKSKNRPGETILLDIIKDSYLDKLKKPKIPAEENK